MTEFAPEEGAITLEDERLDALGEAFLVAGGEAQVIEEDLDDDPIEPVDV